MPRTNTHSHARRAIFYESLADSVGKLNWHSITHLSIPRVLRSIQHKIVWESLNPSRHIYGVGERVGFVVEPVLSGAVLSVVKADAEDNVTFYDLFEVEPGVGGAEGVRTECPVDRHCVGLSGRSTDQIKIKNYRN